MEENQFARTELLLGQKAMERLKSARVAIFGIGGVGGYVCEALARSGVGAFDLIDDDRVSLTNLNRQIIATHATLGKYKVDVMKERILDINPDAIVQTRRCFFLPENAAEFPFAEYDYVVDAVDTVTAKIALAEEAKGKNIPVISSMGAGNKLDGSRFRVADIYSTSVCPLARVMRRELKKRGIDSLKVVYSDEAPIQPVADSRVMMGDSSAADRGNAPAYASQYQENEDQADHPQRRAVPGSTAFVPSVAGLLIAGEVVKDLIS